MEVTDEIAQMLNRDWIFGPHLRAFAAKCLAGCILVNPKTSAAILVNSIGVYARSSLIDADHERSIGKKMGPTHDNQCTFQHTIPQRAGDFNGGRGQLQTEHRNADL